MKNTKTYGIIFLVLIIIIFSFIMYYRNTDWPVKFKSELDHFFGEGNWKILSEKENNSILYNTYNYNILSNTYTKNEPGKYKNWYIQFKSKNGETNIGKITNHTLKINNDKYWIFDSKRYSVKQAFILELMDISFNIVGKDVFDEFISSQLSENEADCIDVTISYYGGNPSPKFYDELFEQPWFTINNINAENFLSSDLYDFHISIKAHDYKVKKLSEEEQQHLFNNFETIQKNLVQKYNNNASFEIYFDKEHSVKYINGVRK